MGSSPSVTQHCANATKIAFRTVIVRFCDGCIGREERCFRRWCWIRRPAEKFPQLLPATGEPCRIDSSKGALTALQAVDRLLHPDCGTWYRSRPLPPPKNHVVRRTNTRNERVTSDGRP